MSNRSTQIEVFQTQAEDLLKSALRASENGRPQAALNATKQAAALFAKVARFYACK